MGLFHKNASAARFLPAARPLLAGKIEKKDDIIYMNRTLRIAILAVLDLLTATAAALLSVYLITGALETATLRLYLPVFLGNVAVMYAVFILFGLYRSVLTYVGAMEFVRIVLSGTCLFLVCLLQCILYPGADIRFAVCYSVFFLGGIAVVRFFHRFLHQVKDELREKKGVRVLIVGAGDAGRTLLREIRSSRYVDYVPLCFLDDDKNKVGLSIDNVPIFGTTDDITRAAGLYQAEGILVAMPSVPRPALRVVLEKCRHTGLRTRMLPGIYQLFNGEAHVGALRDVEISDLLGREQIKVNLDEIMEYIEGQVVLVTGGGGSIGSELCRQIARHRPRLLIILDIYENNAYAIEQELRRAHPDLPLLALIASVRDAGKIEDVFRTYRPQIVFNAAAHKHVPLMETSPNEAVKNNVFGTLNVARMADRYGVRRFVQISTDKAVNPTNIMGATKRICEMIVQAFARHSATEFVAVRFGNVLGSNGSVVPLFKQQIAEGGPVTVTHREITRYFMTIPEAVSLVLQAGAYAKGGEIFVLDMGEPVRIYDLAENLIRLSGLEPGVDIEIQCTGLRPGEKLYEERLMDEEGLQTTPNGMISIARPLEFDEDALFSKLDELYAAAYAETDKMKEMVATLVTTYHVEHHEDMHTAEAGAPA